MATSIMRVHTLAAPLFSTFIFLLCFSSTVLSVSFSKIQLPPNATGPEALAFVSGTGQFCTGIADGRILKYQGPTTGFVDFGFAAPNRSKSVCDGTDTANPKPVCGRPLGLALHHATNRLYVCDAFFGFGVLGPKGGQVTILSTGADGEPFRFCNAVDVHQRTGDVYFTDSSAVYDIRQIETAISTNDSTGRLMKYDFKTEQVTVLFRNLSGAVGVAVDEEAKFVLVSEFIINRTIKIWLQGTKANKFEIINLQPMPDNIKRTASENFWLAAAMIKQGTQSLVPIGQRINASGTVLQTVNFERWYGNKSISEVQEFNGLLHVASRLVNFIGVYKH
ncbi:hypothetical protein SCA6_004143 [Theobroma cacao]|uniref:Calcium-dependent phosphotriesterase superfamily protein, putative n=1 Tax=Theobroma cacao TaxID=3641 RepID=A0A061FXJ5_THECC|nr:Calcium-dependent phosphotriesterase superfamily protein, putative [Theobroma cacao]